MKPVRPQLMPGSGGVGASRVETFKKCKMKNSLFSVSEVSHQLSKGRFCSHTKNLVGKRAKNKKKTTLKQIFGVIQLSKPSSQTLAL